MASIETIPGEPNASIISSIINLVCPQCGGTMVDFECGGRCERSWLPEWEWAIKVTGRADASRPRIFFPNR